MAIPSFNPSFRMNPAVTVPRLPTITDEFLDCVGVFEDEFDYVHNALRRHGISAADVEDLVQEVFLVMWRRWAQYDRTRPVRPWLAGIAFRVAYNHRQRVGREVPGGLIDREDDTPDPEQRLATDTARSLVRNVLASLPEKHRFMIVSHDVEGTSVRELAAVLAVPIPTAHTRLRAARKAFAKNWKRLIAVTATRARIAPLLLRSGLAAEAATAAEELPPVQRRTKAKAIARVRALMPLLPHGFGRETDGGVSQAAARPVPAPIAPPPLWKAWVPVAGSLAVGAALLLAMLPARPVPAASPEPVAAAAAVSVRAPSTPGARFTRRIGAADAPTFTSSALMVSTSEAPARAESLARGLVGYWRFDDGPGSAFARDASGNGNDCHLRKVDPALAWGDGRLGGAVTLSGQGWLECPRVDALARLEAELTIALWVRRGSRNPHVRALVTRQHGSGQLDAFHLGFRDDALALRSRIKGGPLFTGFPRARSQWRHVVASLDATGAASIYVDGQLLRKKYKAGRPSLGGGDNPLIIGGGVNGPDPAGVTELFQGAIDELAVYDRALSPDEVRVLAEGAQPPLSR